jgi:hypothetical protein
MKVQWQEPVEFFRAYMQSTGTVPTRRTWLVAGIIAAAVVLVLTLAYEWFFFLLHQKDLGVPLYFYFVAPAISCVFVWLLPSMLLAIPATIVLNERGMYRNKPFGSELRWSFGPGNPLPRWRSRKSNMRQRCIVYWSCALGSRKVRC